MNYKNKLFRVVNYEKYFPIDSRISIDFSSINQLVEKAAQESGLKRWFENYIFPKAIIDQQSGTVSILGFFTITRTQVQIDLKDRKLYKFLNNSNDLDEWEELLKSCQAFCSFLTEEIYGRKLRPLPREVFHMLNDLRYVKKCVELCGSKLHFKFFADRSWAITYDGFELDFSDMDDRMKTFDIAESGDTSKRYDIRINLILAEMLYKSELEEFIQTFNTLKTMNIFSQNTTEKMKFDDKSHTYGVDLDWNFIANTNITLNSEYHISKSYDGYLGVKKGDYSLIYFRKDIKELMKILKN